MFCSQCGKQQTVNGLYCTGCGVKLRNAERDYDPNKSSYYKAQSNSSEKDGTYFMDEAIAVQVSYHYNRMTSLRATVGALLAVGAFLVYAFAESVNVATVIYIVFVLINIGLALMAKYGSQDGASLMQVVKMNIILSCVNVLAIVIGAFVDGGLLTLMFCIPDALLLSQAYRIVSLVK